MISIFRPRFFIPVHGELRHLVQHGKLARRMGVPQQNIMVVENGYPLYFDGREMHIGERVPGQYVFVDGSLVGDGVKVPTEGQRKRVRAILDELRRRAGDASRPPEERDYIRRLLRRF